MMVYIIDVGLVNKRSQKMNQNVILISPRALSASVDRLGALNAQISVLEKQAKDVKAKLVASGECEIVGKVFKCIISPRESVRLDSKLVKSLLSIDQIAACSRMSFSVNVSLFDL